MSRLHRCADWPELSLFPYDIKTSNFLNVEFTFKYRWQELFSHEKNPETQFLAVILLGNTLIFNRNLSQIMTIISEFFGVCSTGKNLLNWAAHFKT